MRLTFIVVTAILGAATPANAAENVSGGAEGAGSVKITGEYSSDGNKLQGRRPSNKGGPEQCFSYVSGPSESQLFAYEIDCTTGAQLQGPPTIVNAAQPTVPAAVDIEAFARNYIRTLAMPVPNPKMSAPEGIAGARHSLDLQIPNERVFDREQTTFGLLQATAHGRFTVDWGDGTRDNHESPGASWPKSSISHSYTDRGNYDIAVTAEWTVDWRLGGYSGVVTALSTSGEVPDWEVLEAQAVITR